MSDETDPGSELAAVDDAVIGRVFRWSVAVILVVASVVVATVWLNRREAEPDAVEVGPVLLPRHQDDQVVAPTVRFVDITEAAGIDFVHHNGATGKKFLPETMGGGCAFLDYDGDGALDVFLVDSGDWPATDPGAQEASFPVPGRLYRGDGAGGFVDVTAETGIAGIRYPTASYGMGVACGDFDLDGDTDLFITAVGKNRLLRNDGGRKFVDVTGVEGAADAWSTSAAFFDGDGDGDLDLFVCNYVQWSREIDEQVDYRLTGIGRAYGPPTNFEGAQPYYYQNQGDGTFKEVAEASGFHVTNDATGVAIAKSLAVTPVDVDGDGYLDLIVANDTVRNFYYHNLGGGRFEEAARSMGLAYDVNGRATGAMGIDVGRHRGDGSLAVGIGNFAGEMTSFYVLPAGEKLFSDESITEGIGAPSRQRLSFGLFFFDYDLDGRLDLLQVNGHLEEEINQVQASQHYRQPAQLFWNTGREGAAAFVVATGTADLAQPIVGRGAAYGDIDGDGDLDVLLTQISGAPLLLRNDQTVGNHWLRVRLPAGSGQGAWLALETSEGVLRRRATCARSYLSQVEPTVTFGLGRSRTIGTLTVRWPDGTRTEHEPAGVDRLMVIER